MITPFFPPPFISLSPSYLYKSFSIRLRTLIYFIIVPVFVLKPHLVRPFLFGSLILNLSVPLFTSSPVGLNTQSPYPTHNLCAFQKSSLKSLPHPTTLPTSAQTNLHLVGLSEVITVLLFNHSIKLHCFSYFFFLREGDLSYLIRALSTEKNSAVLNIFISCSLTLN